MQQKWTRLFAGLLSCADFLEKVKNDAKDFEAFGVYPSSIQRLGDTVFFIAGQGTQKHLILYGQDAYFHLFDGEEMSINGTAAKSCRLVHQNCAAIRSLFAYTRPSSRGDRRFSMGFGDRLGIASPGHIRAIRGTDVFPVLAQQSMRELCLTGRTYEGVLDDASWAVFQEGYEGGFGADADHLKTKEQVEMALRSGYTMITLDCSDYIENRFFSMDEKELKAHYRQIPSDDREGLEARYLDTAYIVDDTRIAFDRPMLMRCALIYGKALGFITHIYHDVITITPDKTDFEVSVDETSDTTTTQAHFFIASELSLRGVCADSIAPRFCGEFQKGIDYIGDVAEFEKAYAVHTIIADHFGYRLSVHSGSDKFSVFPSIGKHSGLNVHVKTAGTNWLEAVRLIAAKNPSLYRRLHVFALSKLNEARAYYHIGAKPDRIADINDLKDGELPALLEQNDARQVLHITYGMMLGEQKEDQGAFRDEIYETLREHEEDYFAYLAKHIRKHLRMLGTQQKREMKQRGC